MKQRERTKVNHEAEGTEELLVGCQCQYSHLGCCCHHTHNLLIHRHFKFIIHNKIMDKIERDWKRITCANLSPYKIILQRSLSFLVLVGKMAKC